MKIPDSVKSDRVTAFDCEEDILALGTEGGFLICWEVRADIVTTVQCVLDKKVDKLYARHGKVILFQGGLVQVYKQNLSAKFSLAYCKTLDVVDKRKLYGAGVVYEDDLYVPKIPRDQLAAR